MRESLQLRLWNLKICIENVDVKCWLSEMTKVVTSLPLAHVFQWLFTFALVSASRWLADIFKQLSPRWTTGNWRWDSNSRDVIASSPSFSRPAARAPRRVRSQANVIIEIGGSGNVSHHPGALVARVDLLRIQIQFENSKLTFLSKMYRPGSDSWVSQLRLDQQYRKHIKT